MSAYTPTNPPTLTPWTPFDAHTETRDAPDRQSIIMLVRAWGPNPPQFRAAFFAPDGPNVEDWRAGEIRPPRPAGGTHADGPFAGRAVYWPDRESARAACESAFAAWVGGAS